jgi:hypothetical protein
VKRKFDFIEFSFFAARDIREALLRLPAKDAPLEASSELFARSVPLKHCSPVQR